MLLDLGLSHSHIAAEVDIHIRTLWNACLQNCAAQKISVSPIFSCRS